MQPDSDHPELMTKKEQAIWKKMYNIYGSIFTELKSKGLIRTTFTPNERNMLKVIEDANKFFAPYNALVNLYNRDSKFAMEDFYKDVQKYGLDNKILPYLFMQLAISTFLINAEQFKNTLLSLLVKRKISKEVKIHNKMTLGQLLNAIEIVAKNGKSLKSQIDLELRNALTHGLFWFEAGGMLTYATDNSFATIKQISLKDLILKTKDHNIIFQCFLRFIADRHKEGFFT